ncbi:MAG: SDR family oxidoreductase [Planctomycetota bacterium]
MPATARTCVITGASRGIGLATALRFARDGYQIIATARTADRLAAAAPHIRAAGGACEPVVADVARPEDARRVVQVAVERFGRVDVLVNNAGVAPLGTIEQLPIADFDAVLALNIAAVFHSTRAVWPIMRKQGGGVIVNISSVAAVDPFPGFAVYGASKAWVNLFSQAMAAEGKPFGIRVYAVAPGAVETELLRSTFPDLPADRTLAPEAVAGVVFEICGDAFVPCSGQTLFVRK